MQITSLIIDYSQSHAKPLRYRSSTVIFTRPKRYSFMGTTQALFRKIKYNMSISIVGSMEAPSKAFLCFPTP